MYKNYLFDLYGTLVDIHTNEEKKSLWRRMAELYGFMGASYKPKELHKAYIAEVEAEKASVKALHPKYKHIDIQLEKIFDKLLTNKGVDSNMDFALNAAKSFRVMSTKYIKLYDGALDLIQSLKKAGKKVYLLTNAQRCFTEPELKYLGIDQLFDGIVISSDEETCKPDSAFYQIILDRYNLKTMETIMIGNDFITDIKGSRDSGIDSMYIHSNLSPDIDGHLLSTYKVMSGDIKKVKKKLIKD
ncbi:MAG TPA: HAD family hydrolase [Clostridiales bacterium]|nr:HAD family hydrolase [Clostridiales bacterium]